MAIISVSHKSFYFTLGTGIKIDNKSKGKYKGKQPIAIDWVKFGQLYEQWKSGAITAVWFQKEMGLCANNFYRRLKEYERKYI